MKYKTYREYCRALSCFGLFMGLNAATMLIIDRFLESDEELIPSLIATIVLTVVLFIYCWTSNVKREKFKKNGKRYNAYIDKAEYVFNGRGEWTYYLTIAFYEDAKKKFHRTQRYVGSPNDKLVSTNCSIYKWKGKYMEADFKVRQKKDISKELNIPIYKYHQFKRKDKNYV